MEVKKAIHAIEEEAETIEADARVKKEKVISQAKKQADATLKRKEDELEKAHQQELTKIKDEAKAEAKKIMKKFESELTRVEANATKNKKKAVDFVLTNFELIIHDAS